MFCDYSTYTSSLPSLLPKPHPHLPSRKNRVFRLLGTNLGCPASYKDPPLRPELRPSPKGEEEAPAPEGGAECKPILDNPKPYLEAERSDTPTDVSKHMRMPREKQCSVTTLLTLPLSPLSCPSHTPICPVEKIASFDF